MNEFEQSLKAKGHRKEYIKSIKDTAAKIIVTARTIPWDTFEDIRNYYEKTGSSDVTKRRYRLAAKKMEAFLMTGKVPCHRNASHCVGDAAPSLGRLDLFSLRNRLPELQQHMEKQSYSAGYIRRIIIKAERIIVLSSQVEWDSYQDVMDWFDSQDYGRGFLGEIHTVIRLMSAFHLFSIFPDNRETPHPLWPRENGYQKLIPEFRSIVDYGCEAQSGRGLKPSSVNRARSEAVAFFSAMQSKGCHALEEIREKDVLDFFHNGEPGMHRTKIPGLSLFMRDCIPLSPVEFRRIDSLLPISRTFRKTAQYLAGEECASFQDALSDMGNDLSLKQRAIGALFFYNGIRSSDVANLKLDSIDLQKHKISFTQVKTGFPVVLPLLPVVGNAIYDYCTMERPASDSPYLFLGDDAPHHRMSAGSLGWVVTKIMDRAGIRQNPGDRRGTHIFRHRVATAMAENNIPAPVISATLGHSSPKSLDAYLSADITHLRECALSLEKYSIPEEVFGDVQL
ncbi:MAG: tyrosine-type recombinase/integrase [Muribaculaceae bacterium]|nr:tyrosine-type recombinase/integrase [Muribaculaceae bacterium]